MCLVIDNRCHLYEERGFACQIAKPLITKIPLTVYKILNYTKGILQTPFQETPINFISGEAIMTAPMMNHYISGWSVHIGIHAFQTKADARAYLELWSHFRPTSNLAIYEATIPVGTKYFVGIGGDIVSEKLIIKNKIVK